MFCLERICNINMIKLTFSHSPKSPWCFVNTINFTPQCLKSELKLEKGWSGFVVESQLKPTLHNANSLIMPLPLPVSEQRFLTVVGRVYRPKVVSCNWAWWRTCGGNDWFRATYRYALRMISLARTPSRALISRNTLIFGILRLANISEQPLSSNKVVHIPKSNTSKQTRLNPTHWRKFFNSPSLPFGSENCSLYGTNVSARWTWV